MKNLNLNGQLCMFSENICILYPYKHDLVLKAEVDKEASLIFEFAKLNRLLLNSIKSNLFEYKQLFECLREWENCE